jgi:hypothetical protein
MHGPMRYAVEVRNADGVEAVEIARKIDPSEKWERRVKSEDTHIFVFENPVDAWTFLARIPVRLGLPFRPDS